MRKVKHPVFLTIILALLSSGCFGRTAATGIARGDGDLGDYCNIDANCLQGYMCYQSACRIDTRPDVSLPSSPDRDLGGPDYGECENVLGSLVLDVPVYGETVGVSSYAGSCGGDQAPDGVWVLDVESQISLSVTTSGSEFDTLLYVRDGCGASSTELDCNDDYTSEMGTHSRIDLGGLAAGRYYVVVDGFGSGSGYYTLTAMPW